MGMGGNGNVESHSCTSLLQTLTVRASARGDSQDSEEQTR